MSRRIRVPVWLTCLAIALTLLAGGVAGSLLEKNDVLTGTVFAASASAPSTAPTTASQTKPALQTSFAPIVQKVTSSVVNVWSSRKGRTQDTRNLEPFLEDPFFRRFFGDDLFGQAPNST